eukprot:TRINITY_DN22845_c0_g1_i1.p1 TRINITY_DN22845_c0_g1~~TRINITY_DN22845_c0_g1_i1.p1  ORF type:complete len:293 (+),score=42.13 TRINITY_DN22845_c0_g1_i1:124-1002(+)
MLRRPPRSTQGVSSAASDVYKRQEQYQNMATDYSIPSEDASGVWDIGPQYIFKTDLGSGSYGTVCEAIYVATSMPVAIKKFANIYRNETMCKRVLREIEVSFYSTHPVLVKPLDLFCRNGIDLYLVMELAQSDLKKIQKDPIFLLEKQVKIIMYRLLLAVNYLHSGGIIHRDIKPANILLNFDCSIRLCDFSLSRSITGLNSSLFDCDQVIRKDPMLCISGSCSSMTCMRDPAPSPDPGSDIDAVSYTHLRAHETSLHLVCRLLLEKKKQNQHKILPTGLKSHATKILPPND